MKTVIISIISSIVITTLGLLYVINRGDALLGGMWLDRDREEYLGKPWKEVDQELHDQGFYYMGYTLSPYPTSKVTYRHLYCKESVLNTKKYLMLFIPEEPEGKPQCVSLADYLFQCPSYGLEVRGYVSAPNSDQFSLPRGFVRDFKPAVPPFLDIYEKDLDPHLWLNQ